MKATASVFILALLAAGAAHAQLYKWVGPDGKVTYSDVPPPKTAAKVEQKNIGSAGAGAPSSAGLPYEVAQAMNNFPVTLYTGDKCEPCNNGRSYLKQRGIPFSEKTVTDNDDITRTKQLTGESRLPVLTVGRNKQTGFAPESWGTALTAAGYPQTSQLPKSWQQPAAEPAAPKKAAVQPAAHSGKAATAEAPVSTPATDQAPASGNAPPGFRF